MNNPIKYGFCRFCYAPLQQNTNDPCPKCGKKSRFIAIGFDETIKMSDFLDGTHIREFYEENKNLKLLTLGINIVLPFLGLWIIGWLGVVVGIFTGIASIFLIPPFTTKVRQITKFRSV